MTNREWLMEQMQNMSDEEFANTVIICKFIDGRNCNAEEIGCVECNKNWLKAEHKEKPKLSEAERVILENIPKDHKWIARNIADGLQVFKTKPRKDRLEWSDGNGYSDLGAFSHLFQFIKWSDNEAYEISELLKGE